VKKKITLPNIPEQEHTPLVKSLLVIIDQLAERVQQQDEEIAQLKDEINILKGEKKRPAFKGGKLDKNTNQNSGSGKKPNKRAGSSKKKKTQKLTIHEETVVKPDTEIPEGSRFKGYRDFVVQDLHINVHNTRYRLEHWVTPENKSLTAQLPDELNNRHFGPQLRSYILYQHHHCHTTQPKLLEQLQEWGIDISSGQINQLLLSGQTEFHAEKDAILQAGLEASSYVTVDDSGARHQGKNGYVTHIGNEFFAWFQSTDSKSRINFLSLLRAGNEDYYLSDAALFYMKQNKLPIEPLEKLSKLQNQSYTEQDWLDLLDSLSISKKRHLRIATEGALLGSVLKHGLCEDLVIVSDDAGQFNILLHALCWVHTERLIHKMLPLNDKHRADIASVRGQIWDFYADLKRYKSQEELTKYDELKQRFDDIFTQKTSFATLNSALKRIHKNKTELLLVLDRPEIPLHTNGSETAIRDYVKKRKVSGGTRSDEGRRCRDTFTSLKITCRKLGIPFWVFLTDRLGIGSQSIEPLQYIIMRRAALATGY
tara:strand:- start:9 stop:1625 length:1617 start_codon:yes stop_codon:yes gene_type:complete